MRRPGFEPGHVDWKSTVITVRPPTQKFANSLHSFSEFLISKANLTNLKNKELFKKLYTNYCKIKLLLNETLEELNSQKFMRKFIKSR